MKNRRKFFESIELDRRRNTKAIIYLEIKTLYIIKVHIIVSQVQIRFRFGFCRNLGFEIKTEIKFSKIWGAEYELVNICRDLESWIEFRFGILTWELRPIHSTALEISKFIWPRRILKYKLNNILFRFWNHASILHNITRDFSNYGYELIISKLKKFAGDRWEQLENTESGENSPFREVFGMGRRLLIVSKRDQELYYANGIQNRPILGKSFNTS